MKPSEDAYDLIKGFEKFRAKAYWDKTGKVWTIGYGTTRWHDGSKVQKGQTITEQEAETALKRHADETADIILTMLHSVALTQKQFDALVSFVYNIGVGNFASSTILKLIKEDPNNYDISYEFMKWKYSDGKVLGGLIDRRAGEAKHYFSIKPEA